MNILNLIAQYTIDIPIKLLDWIPFKNINLDDLWFKPAEIHLFEQTIINWTWLSKNYAIDILEKNLDKIDWNFLSMNPEAIHILEKNPDKINWKWLSENPAAIHLIEKNLDKIDWGLLSGNPAAIHLLEKNIDKIDWDFLSGNSGAIHLIEKNLDKINWCYLSENFAIFKINKIAYISLLKYFKEKSMEHF